MWGQDKSQKSYIPPSLLAHRTLCCISRWCLKIWCLSKWGPTFLPAMQIPALTERKAWKSAADPCFLHFCPSFTTASISDFKRSPCRGSPSVILVYKDNKSSQDLLSWRPRYPSCSSSLLVSGRGISFDGRPRPVGVLKTAYIQWKFSSSANRIKWTNLVHRWAWAGRM